jgi:hypothetical protein
MLLVVIAVFAWFGLYVWAADYFLSGPRRWWSWVPITLWFLITITLMTNWRF